MTANPCVACGDPANTASADPQVIIGDRIIEPRIYCRECFLELTEGKLPKVTGSRLQGPLLHLTPRMHHGHGKVSG